MADLCPIPFIDLARRMCREAEAGASVFDLPDRKWWVPDPGLDFSALHFARRAATPVGPAAGPHTQLAQNIVLAWLAGSRIIELKTVQVNDRLDIPRPCIHAPNIGYNVEWSQELTVGESLREYAKAAYLIEILKETRAFGRFPTEHGLETVFDISVGYDLEGIRSEKVTGFIRGLMEPRRLFDELRSELKGDLARFRGLEPPQPISDCVTLSTFHGCPADQIESIARYLLEELGLHVIIKLNPTLLGFDEVRTILHDRLGYHHLELRREAFDVDLQYVDGIGILTRLREAAEARGTSVGAKFTNTLVVRNDASMFPTQADPWMYVSGAPLHVISMNLMQRFREDLGFEFPVSFSAGIDVKNFPAAVACGMVPVTTCTDLLKQGGFGRLPGYLKALAREMERVGVSSREAYVLAARGHAAQAVSESPGGLPPEGIDRLMALAAYPDDLPGAIRKESGAAGDDPESAVLRITRRAGRLNGRDIVPALVGERRYHADANRKPPRRIDSTLELYDCINCDLCISACPNDAIFAWEATPRSVQTHVIGHGPGGLSLAPGTGFSIAEEHQLGLFAGACNECSNCEVYCPESGAPFRVKERLFPSAEAFERSSDDGFWGSDAGLLARIGGRELRLTIDEASDRAELIGDDVNLELSWTSQRILGGSVNPDGLPLDTADLWRMRTAWESIYRAKRPNPVNPVGR
ncbi:MAG: 4Fe-4S binding protein [Candidatus Palauibacterales bacterium]|nr:4Fe-4S binding protein [Candidatus Palauibacterales bacterium]MDP2483478.1 4Fe-4S binding protein [Candidatus Palauibacterales bacterium]